MSKSRTTTKPWHRTKEHLFHPGLFEKGMLVAKPLQDGIIPNEVADDTHFTVKSKDFVFHAPSQTDLEISSDELKPLAKETPAAVKKVTNLLLAITHPQIFQIRSLFQNMLEAKTPEQQTATKKSIQNALEVLKTIIPVQNQEYCKKINTIKTEIECLPNSTVFPSTENNKELKKINRHKIISKIEHSLDPLVTQILNLHAKEGIALSNRNRRSEVFRPLILNDNQNSFGMYVFPWLTNTDTNFKFTGFNQFVTAGCLYGSSIKGRDQLNHLLLLIKHDQKFHDGQKIVTIDYDIEALNPYEEMLFVELEKLAIFINTFGTENGKKLNYHLPYYDYILFGIDLFISNRITLDALNSLFTNIFSKKEDMSQQILEIFNEHHGIDTVIESPFDNLFGEINLPDVFKRKLEEDPNKLASDTAAKIIELAKNKETLRQALVEQEPHNYDINNSLIDNILATLNALSENTLSEEKRSELIKKAKNELPEDEREKLTKDVQGPDRVKGDAAIRRLEKSRKAKKARNTLEKDDSAKIARDVLKTLNNSQLTKLAKDTVAKKIKNALAEYILKTLDLSCEENESLEPSKDEAKKVLQEKLLLENRKALVTRCIDKLLNNTHHPVHREIWNDFMNVTDKNHLNNLEDLFKVANAIMIGVAAKKNKDVCTLYPNSEKQIPIAFSDYLKKITSKSDKISSYPSVVYNATVLDPLVVYSPQNYGLPFYCDKHTTQLAELINQHDLLSYALENLALYAKPIPGKRPQELAELLPKPIPSSSNRKPLQKMHTPKLRHSSGSMPNLFRQKPEPQHKTHTHNNEYSKITFT